MGFLTREEILSADDRRTKDINVPEWNGTVRLRSISAAEREQWENEQGVKKGNVNVRATYIALCAIDEEGGRLFEAKDVEALSGKSAAPLIRLYAEALALNAMQIEDVEESEKKSEAVQAFDSSTG